MNTHVLLLRLHQGLLALKQLVIGDNLDVQGQLDGHELLVLAQLPCQVLLVLLQGGFQLGQFGIGILEPSRCSASATAASRKALSL